MKSAARMTPLMSQALRAPARPLARAALAGPSRLAAVAPARAASSAAAAESSKSTESPAIPPNLVFEDLAGSRKEVSESLLTRGEVLHRKPSNPFEPIEHPLSSLASLTPTAPISSGKAVLLPSEVFGKPIRRDILHRNVVWYLSTLRAGNQSTKTRSTVAYSGRKLLPQKGTGRARAGDASSGTRRGGAPIFALHNRDWAQDLPRKVRDLGVRTALSSKLSSGLLRVVRNLNEGKWAGTNAALRALGDGYLALAPKKVSPVPAVEEATATVEDGSDAAAVPEAAEEEKAERLFVQRFGPRDNLSILFIHGPNKPENEIEEFWRTVRNSKNIEVISTEDVVTYDILKYRWIVLEAGAVDAFSTEFIEYEFDGPAIAELEAQMAAAEAAEAKQAEESGLQAN